MKNKIFTTTNNRIIQRISRKLKIHTAYVTKNHTLWDYAESESENDKKRLLIYFNFKGRQYALGQFLSLGSMFFSERYQFEDNGKTRELSGIDCTEYFKPIFIELDEKDETVQVYIEIASTEIIT